MRRVLYLWVPHLHTAVERLLAPGLAGEPVVVASGSFARGVVVDASPEAEALGVGAGQSWRHARRHAPAATFIPYEAARYRPFTERVGDLLHELTPWVETLPGSEEEFFADLGAGSLEEGEILARGARDAIREALGLEARAGLATGKLAARTACRVSGVQAFRRSGVQAFRPGTREAGDGLPADFLPSSHQVITPGTRKAGDGHQVIILPPGTERRFLRPLSLDYLWDMAPEHRRRLGPLGLRTFGQLAAVPPRLLIDQFGPVGRWYRLLAAGSDARRVKAWTPHPALSSRLIIEEEPADLPLLEGYLELLARRVSDLLIATGQYARTISLMLEADGARPFASRHLKAPTNLPAPIRRAGHELLVMLLKKQAGDGRRQTADGRRQSDNVEGLRPPVTLPELPSPVYRLPSPQAMTLVAGNLETRGLIQLSLFGDPDRGPALRAAIARIQDRFGEAAITPAGRLAERVVMRREIRSASRAKSRISEGRVARQGPGLQRQELTPHLSRLTPPDGTPDQ